MRRLSLSWISALLAAAVGAAWAGSGCVNNAPLADKPSGPGGGTVDAGPPAPPPDAAVGDLPPPDTCADRDAAAAAPYQWSNATILGGGFVSGIEFSHVQQNLIYARTDVGGAYRWNLSVPADPTSGRWTAITDWVGRDNSNMMGIESVAPDPVDPNVVYLAAGEYLTTNGFILRSADQGATWEPPHAIGVFMGGNADGRNVGERLAVDPNAPSTLYFASRNNGLYRSTDQATTWSQVTSFPTKGTTSYGLSLVFFDATQNPSVIYVGVSPSNVMMSAGIATLYRSTDSGATWQTIRGDPMAGQFPMHAASDGVGNLYLTYGNISGPNNVTAGTVWKLNTASSTWTNTTFTPDPTDPTMKANINATAGKGGFGGVSVYMPPSANGDPSKAIVVASSLDRWPDVVYRSTDGAQTWAPIAGTGQGQNVAGAVWLNFGGGTPNATGWMGDIEIDPFDPDRVLYNTGQGIWASANATTAPHWTFLDDGLEETVALGLISPSGGGANLLSAVGDICGFRHTDLSAPSVTGMFDNPVFGNTTGLDFAEQHPSLIARVGTGTLSRHGAFSVDEGATWTQFYSEPNLTDAGGSTMSGGSIAVSADGTTFVWAPQPATRRATATPAFSTDRSRSWTPSVGLPSGAKVASDRVDPMRFYATSGTMLLQSINGGATFTLLTTLPMGGGTVRPAPGHAGDLWVATNGGLLHYTDQSPTLTPIGNVTVATAVGFGRAASCADYPILYLTGQANGVSGVYRSDDQAASWTRIDDPYHQFGFSSYITGDPRVYGRVYLGSGGRGILVGNPMASP